MDITKFELAIKNFFVKAGVDVLKIFDDYTGNDSAPDYLLLDAKRKTCYLAETDIPNDTDLEINAALSDFNLDGLNEDVARAILKAGRAFGDTNAIIDVPTLEITSFERKTALIISEENASALDAYLASNSIATQRVPLKGMFVVHLIDAPNSQKIADLYTGVAIPTDIEQAQLIEDTIEDTVEIDEPADIINDTDPFADDVDDLVNGEPINNFDETDDFADNIVGITDEGPDLIDEPTLDVSDTVDIDITDEPSEPTIEDAPIDEIEEIDDVEDFAEISDIDEAINEEPTLEAVEETIEDIIEDTEENLKDEALTAEELKQLQDLDVDALIPEVSEIDEVLEEDDNLYSGILDEDEKLHKVASAPKHSAEHFMEKADINEEPEPKWVEETEQHKPDNVAPAQAQNITETKDAKPKKKKEPKEKKPSEKRELSYYIYSVIALFVATPQYVLGLATKRVLPAFIIYWLSAVAVIFGVYKVLAMPLGALVANKMATVSEHSANMVAAITSYANSATADISNNALLMKLSSSAMDFAGYAALYNNYGVDYLLQYLPAVGALVAVMPVARRFGLTLMVSSAISYIAMPFILSFCGRMAFSAVSSITELTSTDAVMLIVSKISLYATVLPLVALVAIFIISSWLLPRSFNKDGVLP